MKYIAGLTDIFIDPVTGEYNRGGGGDKELPELPEGMIWEGGKDDKAFISTALMNLKNGNLIAQHPIPNFDNIQALDELPDGIMRKKEGGVIETSLKFELEDLPELKGEVISGLWGGDVFRGTKDGKVERSSSLTKVEADLIALNTKFLIADFVMISSYFKPVWQGATFIDEINPGLLYNEKLPGGKHRLRQARPGSEYMQGDLGDNKIWFGKPERGYDAETVQITAPWIRDTYIVQKPTESSPNAQALSDLGVGINDVGLVNVDNEGKIHKATLANNKIWRGNENNLPIEVDFEGAINNAKYILQENDESLPNAQALKDLEVIGGPNLLMVDFEGVLSLAKLKNGYVWQGDEDNEPKEVKMPAHNVKYVVKEPHESVPDAIALSELQIPYPSLVTIDNNGLIERARLGHKFIWQGQENGYPMAVEVDLEELERKARESAEKAKESEEQAKASAEEASAAAEEATGAAGEATTAAGTATTAATAAGASAVAAGLSATKASSSASSADNSALKAETAKQLTEEYLKEVKESGVEFTGDVEGKGKLNEQIQLKIKDNPVFAGSGCITISGGKQEDRPQNPIMGMLRFLTNDVDNTCVIEYYNGIEWLSLTNQLLEI